MITAQNVKDSFLKYKQDITDVPAATFLEWVQFTVDFLYQKLKAVDPERFVQAQSYVVTACPQTETLPTALLDLNQTSCGVYRYDVANAKPTTEKLSITKYGSEQDGYYFTGKTIVFTGSLVGTYVLRFMPQRPTIATLGTYLSLDGLLTGQPIVEDRHLRYFAKAVDVLYEQWDRNPQAESVADFRFVRELGEILSSYNRLPQISVMENPANNF